MLHYEKGRGTTGYKLTCSNQPGLTLQYLVNMTKYHILLINVYGHVLFIKDILKGCSLSNEREYYKEHEKLVTLLETDTKILNKTLSGSKMSN